MCVFCCTSDFDISGVACQGYVLRQAGRQWCIQQKLICVPLSFNNQRRFEVHDIANKRVLSVFTLNRLQAGNWVWVNYYIVVDCVHVLVIVQCQSDGCSLSSKDGAVVWQSFGQAAAGCLIIPEMLVDNCHCPHSLIYFGVKTSSCDPGVSRCSLNLAWASGLETMHLFTPSMRLCLFRL